MVMMTTTTRTRTKRRLLVDPRTGEFITDEAGGGAASNSPAPRAGIQSMGRVRPQASASPYRQQPQKRCCVRF